MPETHVERFKKLLAELFMFDQADLDFGIYRIMNAKREEITRFLDADLLPQVRGALGELEQADRAVIEAELAKAIDQAKSLGADPESLPKVKGLRQQLAEKGDLEALEREVFSDLYNFFRRYYNEGDFLSLRRYKEGVYAIPYEGEEVKLHWANADQYYIKTAENFRDYIFKLPDGSRVHFKLAEADTEQNNNTPANGQERRFILREADPVAEENGELVARFEFRADTEKPKQADLNELAVRRIFEAEATRNWLAALATKSPTEKNPDRTVLDKHLADYTARNTFDYFIHKDLCGFLRRELDFFIKNEVMHLDDIESESAPRVDRYLARVRAIRRIAHKIIDFLAQIENFQKKLWLKKKFVVETNYCITLDRIPEDLYPEIAANDAQREEWVRLYAIDEVKKDLAHPGYSVPLHIEFLKAHSTMVVDTRHFSCHFVTQLLETLPDIDSATDGLVVRSENFQALSMMRMRYRGQVRCIYIDPPYNTDGSPISYKNGYRTSSWVTMVRDRILSGVPLLKPDGVLCVMIDDYQLKELLFVLQELLTKENLLGIVAIRVNPSGRITKNGLALTHEYALFVGASQDSALGRIPRTPEQTRRFKGSDENGIFEWRNFRREGSSSEKHARPRRFFPLYCSGKSVRVPKLEWLEEKREYSVLEEPKENETVCYPRDKDNADRVWRWGLENVQQNCDELEARQDGIGKWQVYYKYRPGEEGVLAPSVWVDAKYSATEHGTGVLKALFGARNVFSFPKSVYATADCINIAGMDEGEGVCLDYFAGSGTTAHAVINLNREDDGNRKYILAETGEYFDSVLIPRIKKVVYSKEWKDGKPVSADGTSHMFKYIRLESYEDALNNLELKRTREQGELIARNPALREDYVLRYMLDVESQNSASVLDLNRFEDPFSYKLKVGTGSAGETQLANVDLVETLNWLLGLRVRHFDTIRGFRVVQGTNPLGEKVLVIWRNTREKSNGELDEFFLKQGYNTRDMEFDLIYVNGDNNLENLKRPDETWKVRLIDEEFKRLMFDVEAV
jgi:adenine-specific DNA-methyltransferase